MWNILLPTNPVLYFALPQPTKLRESPRSQDGELPLEIFFNRFWHQDTVAINGANQGSLPIARFYARVDAEKGDSMVPFSPFYECNSLAFLETYGSF